MVSVFSEVRWAHSLVGACGRRSPPQCALSPSTSDLGSILSTPWRERRVGSGWRGDWTCCYKGIPQSVPKGLFLFGKILLFNPAAPSIQGRACPLTQPTSPARQSLSGSGPNTTQFSSLPSQRPQSLWVYHYILIPLPVTSSNQVSLNAAQALFGRGGNR